MDELNRIFEYITDKNIKGLEFYIAGGACVSQLLNDEIKDFDIFTNKLGLNLLISLSRNYIVVDERCNSMVLKHKEKEELLDIVICEDPIQTIKDFDLKHCCVYYDGKNIVEAIPDALSLAKNKKLVLNIIKFPYLTLGRIAKYKAKGFSIDRDNELNILDYCYKAPWGPNKEYEYSFGENKSEEK